MGTVHQRVVSSLHTEMAELVETAADRLTFDVIVAPTLVVDRAQYMVFTTLLPETSMTHRTMTTEDVVKAVVVSDSALLQVAGMTLTHQHIICARSGQTSTLQSSLVISKF